jgi:CheY-like chemotaxis protein
MKKHEIDLLIVDDNETFNLLLEHELSEYLKQKPVKYKFQVNILTFLSSEECIQFIKKRPPNKHAITFLDYYLGEAINGFHVLKLLREQNYNMQIIIMSRSSHVKEKILDLNRENINLNFIVKDEYTPAMCKILLENYLENFQ